MTRRHRSTALVLAVSALVACTPAAVASAQTFDGGASFSLGQAFSSGGPTSAGASDDYTRGTQALDQQRWQDAITAFDKVVRAHDKRADASLYWKAYALNKLGRTSLVSAICDQLLNTYPRSTWNRDCSTLLAASTDPGIYAGGSDANRGIHPTPQPNDNGIVRNAPPHRELESERTLALQQKGQALQVMPLSSEASTAAGSDADLKMLALNSVLQRDPSQALPVIRNILNGGSAPQLKRRALTTLAMSQSPDAQSLLRDVALGKIAPTEQRDAIQMLGAFQGKHAGDTLAEIYRTSPDRNIKRTAVSGLFVAGDAPHMVELARNEKDLQLKHDIVAQLALMHDKAATDYMLELLK